MKVTQAIVMICSQFCHQTNNLEQDLKCRMGDIRRRDLPHLELWVRSFRIALHKKNLHSPATLPPKSCISLFLSSQKQQQYCHPLHGLVTGKNDYNVQGCVQRTEGRSPALLTTCSTHSCGWWWLNNSSRAGLALLLVLISGSTGFC